MAGVQAGSLVHVEFASKDPRKTREFLAAVFGWEFQSTPEPDYFVFSAATGPGGAVTPATKERPGGVLNYLLSQDIDRDLERVARAGGKIRTGKTEIPHVGWWALFEEPSGSQLALFQSASPDRGPEARYRLGR